LTQRFFPAIGGVEEHVLQISKGLISRGHSVTIFTSDLEKDRPFARLKVSPRIDIDVKRFTAVRIVNLRYGLGIISPSMLLNALKEDVDVVHAHGFGYWPTFVGMTRRALDNTPLVITPHSNPGSKIYGFLDVRALPLKFADRVIALTLAEKNHLQVLGLNRNKIEVIPNGIDFKDYEGLKNMDEGDIVAYVGRVDINHKGLDTLIKAIPMVLKKVREARFIIAGPDWGDMESLKKTASKLNVMERVTFTGSVPRKEKIKIYAMAKLCVFPSNIEPFGIAILEAMSSGKPIVATNVGGIPELIKNGWTGILVPPRNPRALADAVSYLLLNPDEATKMGERARAVARNYSWDNVVDKILRVYEALASHRAVSPPITTILSPK